jgi:hypothetical protein
MSAGMILLWGSGGTFDARGEKGVCTDAPDRNCFNLGAGTSLQLSVVACRALSMASATPAADVPSQSTALDFHLSCWVAERRRCGERICRSWPPKHHSNCSVRVMLVTQTGDKVVYHVGRSKGRARTQTARGGLQHGRRGERRRVSAFVSYETGLGLDKMTRDSVTMGVRAGTLISRRSEYGGDSPFS